jgi:hypothetical protein
MVVTKKAEISGYHAHVWYNKNAIANILSLRNVIKQYPVTYDSDYEMFVVHRESVGKKNMEFRMHESGIHHYYDPRNDESDFITPVSGIQQCFTRSNGAAKNAGSDVRTNIAHDPPGAHFDYNETPGVHYAHDPPGAHFDDDKYLSEDDTKIPGVHTSDTIPGLPDAKIPGAAIDYAEIPGVTEMPRSQEWMGMQSMPQKALRFRISPTPHERLSQ